MFSRRQVVSATAASLLSPLGAAAQGHYPDHPVTLTIGYAPGALTDIMVRMIAERMGRELGQAVIVDNRSGGATSIASTFVAQAKPDGYTLLIGTNSLAINPALQPGMTPRDPMRELQPVGLVYYSPFVLLVHETVPVHSLDELVAYARANPHKLDYGSSGIGSVNHLLTELFLQKAGIRIEHIPYRGGGPALVDFRAGRVQLFYATPLDAEPLVKEGKGRMLAISSRARLPSLPDIPSIAEHYPGCDGVLWQGLFTPPGAPRSVTDRLYTALRATLTDPTLSRRTAEYGVVLMDGDAEALRRHLGTEMETWGNLIRSSGIRAE